LGGGPRTGEQPKLRRTPPHRYLEARERRPVELALAAAKLRHELEHARQWDELGDDVFRLNGLADQVLWEVYNAQPGSSFHYNQKPVELDANAAAARFLRNSFPPDVAESLRLHEEGLAYRTDISPAEPVTLIRRTLEFMLQYPEACETAAFGLPLERLLESQYEIGIGEMWRALRADVQ
jgi:hypothetical protein